jgi:ADP-ribosyl-[dinitrogen reductase] hydrolase
MSNKSNPDINKFMGAIHGVIYGDAFGARYEFKSKDEAITQLENDKMDNYYPILGGGQWNVEPGQVTDDSEMMISLLNALVENKDYKQDKVAINYIKWYASGPVDIGGTTRKALDTRKKATSNTDMINFSNEMNANILSNGALMRIIPLALFGLTISNKKLKYFVDQECNLTHPHKIVKEMVYIYCLAVKYALLNYDKQQIFDKIFKKALLPRTRITLLDAKESPEPTYVTSYNRETYTPTDSIKYQGYIGIALQNAIYELLHGDNLNDSIINVAKRGGDTDTTCAIAGGLLGAYYGKNKFNPNWYKTLQLAGTSVKRFQDYLYLNPLTAMDKTSIIFYNYVIQNMHADEKV